MPTISGVMAEPRGLENCVRSLNILNEVRVAVIPGCFWFGCE
jgi:hypothetical protein